jgi:hypothetical protein
MERIGRLAFTVVAVSLLTVLAYRAVSELDTARNRSRQKRTMALLRDTAIRIEAGMPVVQPKDAWGYPLQVRVNDSHYSIRSAGSDGKFEKTDPRGYAVGSAADIVLAEGTFLQYPEGI